jgi:DNA-binding protein H-NS
MKRNDLESLSIDELCVFRKDVATALAAKLVAEKRELENRLIQLTRQTQVDQIGDRPKRRSYPAVFPKYRNPNQPSETWAGRGKQPRWLAAELKSGKRLDDFRLNLVLRK